MLRENFAVLIMVGFGFVVSGLVFFFSIKETQIFFSYR